MLTNLDLRVIDMYDDRGALLLKAFEGREPPPLMKLASDMSSPSMRHPEDYALNVLTERGAVHKFPLTDVGNTIASAVYFADNKQHLPEGLRKEAAARINIALQSFNLPVPEGFTKTASIELGYSGGAETSTLAELFGVNEVDSAWEELSDEFSGLSPRGKRRFAMQVKTAGVNTSNLSELEQYLGDEVGTDFSVGIIGRAYECAGDSAALAKLASIRESNAEPDELVEMIEQFDFDHNISRQYSGQVLDPVRTVYGGGFLEKTSSTDLVEIDGRSYGRDDIVSFSQSSNDALSSKFGDSFASEFAADPVSVLESLPDPHKAMIAGMIDAG